MGMQAFEDRHQPRWQSMLGEHCGQTGDDSLADRQADSEFQQEFMYLVIGLGAITHQRITHAMQGRQSLLRFRLRRYKPHGRTRRRFANRLSIHKVVLVTLDERPYELRRDEFGLMPECSQLASHMVRASAGLHHHRARVKCGKKLDELLTANLLAKHGFAVSVLTVKVEGVLTQIDSNQRRVLHDGLLGRKHPVSVTARGGMGATISLQGPAQTVVRKRQQPRATWDICNASFNLSHFKDS